MSDLSPAELAFSKVCCRQAVVALEGNRDPGPPHVWLAARYKASSSAGFQFLLDYTRICASSSPKSQTGTFNEYLSSSMRAK
jgi:hypothetical protein